MSKNILQRKRILTKAGGGSSISTPVSVANGGTGLASYAIGDIIYASGATTLSKLAIGTASQQLRVNAGATALEYFTPAASGITVGTTTISSGTSGSVLMDIGGVVTESISYRANANTSFGQLNLSYYPTSGTYNSVFGYNCGQFISSGSYNTYFGANIASGGTTSGTANTAVGSNAFGSIGAGNYNTGIGYNVSVGSNSSSIVIGNRAIATASHQGVLAANDSFGYVDNWYFNGVTHTAAYSVNLRGSGGLGSNNVGANLNLYAGLSTGSGTPAVIGLYSSAVEASSSTPQTAVKVLEITNSTTITTSDAVNYALGSSTGTKLGTADTQKLAFWNATPIVQPSGATQAAPAAYATGAFGLDSDANMQALYDLVVAMRTALVNVGIMKGSA